MINAFPNALNLLLLQGPIHMLRLAFVATTTLLLSACAGIAHDTPEARQQITRDLRLQQIDATATMSYCQFALGGIALCRDGTPGIGVISGTSLLLVDYTGGAYKADLELTTKDVRCISESDGHQFYVFTDDRALMLIPYTNTGAKPNPVFREKAIKLLLSDGQPYLKGLASNFIRDSGRKQYGATSVNIGGGPVYMGTSSSILEIFSPCAAESK